MPIDVDDPQTWPPSVAEAVSARAGNLRGTTEFTADLDIPIEEEDEFRELLEGHLVRAYHATRLLDEEADNIRERGLRPLSHGLVMERIQRAHRLGYVSREERDRLESSGNVFATREHGNREGLTGFFLSTRVLDEEVGAIWSPLTTWGGEAVYMTADGARIRPKLQTIGTPTIVVALLDLSGSWRMNRTSPSLQKVFVGEMLKLQRRGGGVHYSEPVPAEHIDDLWQPGHPRYDSYDELPS